MQFESLSVVLVAEDVAASRGFYVEHLGFEVCFDIGWFATIRHPNAGIMIDLWRQDHEAVPDHLRRPVSGVLLAFMVADVDAQVARLRQGGVAILQPGRDNPWGQRNAIAQGPDGVAIDLIQRIAPDPAWLVANGLT